MAELARPGIRFNLERVQYMGKDTYRVELMFENETEMNLAPESFKNEFSVQSEKIGQWIPLAVTPEAGAGQDPPNSIRTFTVRIPENLPRMYRNMDGEVNLKIFSHPVDGASLPMDPERFYWVSPGSAQWILREGM